MIRFFVIFVVLLVTLFSLRITTFGNDYVTEPFTVILAKVSGFLIKLWDPNVYTTGVEIWTADRTFGVGIAPGCDGIEAVIILISAIVAFPSPWKHKLIGIGIGFIAIQSLNLVRIISLFYMGQWSQTWFDWFHLYLWQALLVLDALAVGLIGPPHGPRRGRPGRGTPPSSPDAGMPATA